MTFSFIVTVNGTIDRYDCVDSCLMSDSSSTRLSLGLNVVGEISVDWRWRNRIATHPFSKLLIETLPSLLHVIIILHDPIAAIHSISFVAHDLPSGSRAYSASAHQPVRRPSEVVQIKFGKPDLTDCLLPLSSEVPDWLTNPAEQPGRFGIELVVPHLFGFEVFQHVSVNRSASRVSVLGLSLFEFDHIPFEVHLFQPDTL